MEAETDDQHSGEGESSRGGRLADGQALTEIVEAEPGRDHEGQAPGRWDGGRYGCDRRPGPAQLLSPEPQREPAVDLGEPEQTDGEAADVDGDQADERPRGSVVEAVEGALHRPGGLTEDLHQQEDQHAGRQGIEETLGPSGEDPHARDRETQKDGQSRNRAQQGD